MSDQSSGQGLPEHLPERLRQAAGEIFWLDLEIVPQSQQLRCAGVLFAGESWCFGPESLPVLRQCLNTAMHIGGHNLLAFDLPELARLLDAPDSELQGWQHRAVDTLLYASVLLPHQPTQALAKLYRIKGQASDPVQDCLETRAVWERCVAAWQGLPAHMAHWLEQKLPLLALPQIAAITRPQVQDYWPPGDALALIGLLDGLAAHDWANLGALGFAHWLHFFDKPTARRPVWLADYSPYRHSFLKAEQAFWGGTPLAVERLDGECQGFFGYVPRAAQRPILEAVLHNQNAVLGLLPTGGGKTLTFQLPALLLSKYRRALTVVVSPLKALMQDQVINLRAMLPAGWWERVACLYSGQTSEEQAGILDGIWQGGVDLLYLSPERLRSQTMQRLLRNRRPAFWVIDEAHTLSQWGTDFRPDFLRIGQVIGQCHQHDERAQDVRLLLVTATASKRVLDDLNQELVQPLAKIFAKPLRVYGQQGQVWRDEITAQNLPVPREQHLERILKLLLERQQELEQDATLEDGVALVYVRNRDLTEKYASQLAEYGLRTAAYHARRDPAEKARILAQFKNAELDVVVCTNAFGMGIDRRGIHTVIHSGPPANLESYLQEIGRAARAEGETAKTWLLWDQEQIQHLFAQDRESRIRNVKVLHDCWKELRPVLTHAPGERWFVAPQLRQALGVDESELPTQVRVALLALERHQLLVELDQQPAVVHLECLEAPASLEGSTQQLYAQILPLAPPGQPQALYLPELAALLGQPVRRLLLGIRQLVEQGTLRWVLEINVRLIKTPVQAARQFSRQRQALEALHQLIQHHPDGWGAPAGSDVLAFEVHPAAIAHELKQQQLPAHAWNTVLALLQDLALVRYRRQQQRHWIEARHPQENPGRSLLDWLAQAEQALLPLEALLARLHQLHPVAESTKTSPPPCHRHVLDTLANTWSMGADELLGQLEQLHQLGLLALGRLDEEGSIFFIDPGKTKKFHQNSYRYLQHHYDDRSRRLHLLQHWLALPDAASQRNLLERYFTEPIEALCAEVLPEPEVASSPWPVNYQKRIFPPQLNALQSRLIRETSRAVMVLAGPGSGKTTVIVHRVANLVALENVDPARILVMAFGRRAVHEVRQRLLNLLGEVARGVQVHTFHSLARSVTGLTERDAPAQALTAQGARQQEDSRFRWLIQQAVAELADTPSPYQYVMVDEFQDIDDDQYALIARLANLQRDEATDSAEGASSTEAGTADAMEQSSHLMVVGDDDQNLYSFRGASIVHIQNFEREYCIEAAHKYFLTTNYRSAPNLVALANAYIQQALPAHERLKGQDSPIQAHRQDSGQIRFAYSQQATLADAAVWVTNRIRQHLDAGGQACQIAVLAPQWQALQAVQHYLHQAGIAYRLRDDQQDYSPLESVIGELFMAHLQQLRPLEPLEAAAVDYLRAWQQSQGHGSHDLAWQALLDQAARLESANPSAGMLLQHLQQSRYQRDEQVVLCSHHSAKGCEYDEVIVWPTSTTQKPDSSQCRAIYVALTRARHRLSVVLSAHSDPLLVRLLHRHGQPESLPETTPPSHWCYQRQLQLSEIFLSHKNFVSDQGRSRIQQLALWKTPLTLQATEKGLVTAKGYLAVPWSGGFASSLTQTSPILKLVGFCTLRFEQNDLVWYQRAGYLGTRTSHFVLVPLVLFQVPVSTRP